MILGMDGIKGQLGRGVIIDPYNEGQVNTSSYDVRICPWFFRQHGVRETGDFLFNPYNPEVVKAYYGEPQIAPLARDIPNYDPEARIWKGILPCHRVIIFQSDEMILGCTFEFIGGTRDPQTGRCFTTEMRARSSIGRIGLEVCRCAGWGDVGYINRWTLEVVCTSRVPLLLVVANLPEDLELPGFCYTSETVSGTRVAQIVFHETTPVRFEDLYGSDDRNHYQVSTRFQDVVAGWHPRMLLPKLTTT